jgi:glycosyltransferase involved in cell wall biosynthesis
MAYGVPIVCHLASTAIEWSGGVLDPATCPVHNTKEDPEDLANILERLIDDPELVDESARKTWEWVNATHSYHSVASRWINFIGGSS